jgi:hypothetical protein
MTEFLFNTTLLTDMGCTLRLFRREALELIRPHLTIGGSHFGPQLLLEVIAHEIPFVEIPVNYRTRVGVSSVTGDMRKAVRLGLRMIALVLEYRAKLFRSTRASWSEGSAATRSLAALARLSSGEDLSMAAAPRAPRSHAGNAVVPDRTDRESSQSRHNPR